MNSNLLTLVTPTFGRDLERFAFQRESIERCGIDIPQVAVVNHEDVGAFERIPFRKNLTVVSTADVLPRDIERRRVAAGMRRRNPLWWRSRLFCGKPLHGWVVQQFAKLAAAAAVETEACVCLDSDIFFVRHMTCEDFFEADGRLHLYETTDDLDVEMAGWQSDSMRFLGLRVTKAPLYRYIHGLVPLHRRVTRDMLKYIQTQRPGGNWAAAMIAAGVYEYPTYGCYARFINDLADLAPTRPAKCAYFWWLDEVERMEADFAERVIDNRQVKAVLVQSNTGRAPSDYRHLAERAWENAMEPTT